MLHDSLGCNAWASCYTINYQILVDMEMFIPTDKAVAWITLNSMSNQNAKPTLHTYHAIMTHDLLQTNQILLTGKFPDLWDAINNVTLKLDLNLWGMKEQFLWFVNCMLQNCWKSVEDFIFIHGCAFLKILSGFNSARFHLYLCLRKSAPHIYIARFRIFFLLSFVLLCCCFFFFLIYTWLLWHCSCTFHSLHFRT